MDPVLSVEALAISYGAVAALQPISFQLAQGGLALVLGPNGAGKSSLVRALAGAVHPQQGCIRLAGEDVTRIPAYKRVRRGIALVPEGRGTLPGLSVLDNLDLGWHSAPTERRRKRKRRLNDAAGRRTCGRP